jgi:hypothetical protein
VGDRLTRPFRDARRFTSTRWYPVPGATRTTLGFGICPSFKGHSLSPLPVHRCRLMGHGGCGHHGAESAEPRSPGGAQEPQAPHCAWPGSTPAWHTARMAANDAAAAQQVRRMREALMHELSNSRVLRQGYAPRAPTRAKTKNTTHAPYVQEEVRTAALTHAKWVWLFTQDMFPSLMRMSILPPSTEGNAVLRGEMKQLIRNGSLTKEHRALLKTAESQKPNKRLRSQSPSLSGAPPCPPATKIDGVACVAPSVQQHKPAYPGNNVPAQARHHCFASQSQASRIADVAPCNDNSRDGDHKGA